MPRAWNGSPRNMQHRAFCDTCEEAVGEWTDASTATRDADRHRSSETRHEVQVVTDQSTSASSSRMRMQATRHRAYCETCDKAVGKWTDEPSAEEDANKHLRANKSHATMIVTQQFSARRLR